MNMVQLTNEIANKLKRYQKWLAVAESCSGGLLASTLTSIPGSSAWFDCGWVTYSNSAKMMLLNVPATLLETEGAVSEKVVQAMAQGAIHLRPVDFSIAISGIAGPDGGTPEKPVGTVWIAWANKNKATHAQLFHFSGNREEIRQQAVTCSLQTLLDLWL